LQIEQVLQTPGENNDLVLDKIKIYLKAMYF